MNLLCRLIDNANHADYANYVDNANYADYEYYADYANYAEGECISLFHK